MVSWLRGGESGDPPTPVPVPGLTVIAPLLPTPACRHWHARATLVAGEAAVGHPVRTGRFDTKSFHLVFLVSGEVALNQNHLASLSSSPSHAKMCVQVRSRNQRSWEITTAQPGKLSSAFSNELSVSTSRSLVGSSSRIRLPPSLRVSARLSRLRSPPDSTPAGFCWSGPLNPNADTYARDGISFWPTSM